jgi:hypothetical protein
VDHLIDLAVLIALCVGTPFAALGALQGVKLVRRAWRRMETESDMLSADRQRHEELAQVRHRADLAELHAKKIRSETATLALMEVAQMIKPGDILATKALMDGRAPNVTDLRERLQYGQVLRGPNFPTPPSDGAGYFEDLQHTYRVAAEIDAASAVTNEKSYP